MTMFAKNRILKSVFAIALSLALACALPFGAFAANAEQLPGNVMSSEPTATASSASKIAETFMLDTYNLFDSSDANRLNSIGKNLAGQYGVGVYFLTCSDIGSSSVRDFAENAYRKLDLGVGSKKSGIMFLVAVESRDYVTVTYGEGIHAFTDWQINEMEEAIVSELKDDQWLSAAEEYYDRAQYTLEFLSQNGEPLDYDNAPKEPTSPLEYLMGLLASLVAAGAGAAGLTRGPLNAMKSAKEQDYAFAYVPNGGVQLTGQFDNYTHSTTVVVETPEPDHDSGGWGGSTISSSGFGGSSGGKF